MAILFNLTDNKEVRLNYYENEHNEREKCLKVLSQVFEKIVEIYRFAKGLRIENIDLKNMFLVKLENLHAEYFDFYIEKIFRPDIIEDFFKNDIIIDNYFKVFSVSCYFFK